MKMSECKKVFKEENARFIKENRGDIIKLNLEWTYFLDSLCKGGQITPCQYDRAGNLFYKRKR